MNTLTLILFAGLAQGLVGAVIGHYKGRTWAGFWFGFFLGFIGWILVALGPTISVRVEERFVDPKTIRISADDPDIQAHLARKARRGE